MFCITFMQHVALQNLGGRVNNRDFGSYNLKLLVFHQTTQKRYALYTDDAYSFEPLHPLVLVQCHVEWE